jgi:Fe-S-cluster-containing hydrogenase component 2
VFKTLFDVLWKSSSLTPQFTQSRCLLEHHVTGGCDKCLTACPHEALEVKNNSIKILEHNCTGCGLCVQACPTKALEYDLKPILNFLKNQGIGTIQEPVQATLKCSKVSGKSETILCMGQITPTHLIASAAWNQNLELVHGACSSCEIADGSVVRRLQDVRLEAEKLAPVTGNDQRVKFISWKDSSEWLGSERPKRLEIKPKPSSLSRRDALQSLFGSAKRGVAQVIPDNPLPGVNAKLEASRIPEEWIWRKQALTKLARGAEHILWKTPKINQSCTLCQVCEFVCPTKAITRSQETQSITLEVSACIGCNACTVSCPENAIELQTKIPSAYLELTISLFESS